jgi:hypothetical protein
LRGEMVDGGRVLGYWPRFAAVGVMPGLVLLG